jgi:hypothetical protein
MGDPEGAFMRELLASQTEDELYRKLAALRCERPFQIRVLVGGSREPMAQLISRPLPFRLAVQRKVDFLQGSFDYGAGELRLSGEIFFCHAGFERISYVISVCSRTVWERAAVRLARALYPALIPVYFSQGEMLGLLEHAKTLFPDARLRISGHTRKKRLKVGTRRKYESSRTKTERPLEIVFREAQEQNFWFQSISFDYLREGRSEEEPDSGLPSATISKYGAFFCTSDFERFRYGILREMAQMAESKVDFFSNRSRRSVQRYEARPISITFEGPVFRTGDDNKHFVGLLRKMPGVSCSVLHGNPYVHLFVRDRLDDSGAELWVLKDDEVLLIPQLKASEAALKRMVNYIFEEWREGQVGNLARNDDGLRSPVAPPQD